MAGERDAYPIIMEMIAEAIKNIALPEPAIVTNVYPDTYTVQCRLIYDQVITGKLRVMESFTGNGFGITNLPQAGDEVMVLFQGGRPNDGYVVGRMYGPDDRPAAFTYGDWQMRHQSGSKLLLNKAGDLIATGRENSKLLLKANGQLEATSSGNAKVTLQTNGTVEAMSSSGVKLTLSENGTAELHTANGTFKMTAAGQFVMSNATAELLGLLDDLLTQLTTVGNMLCPPPTGIGNFNPATIALMTVIKTKLATLKQ